MVAINPRVQYSSLIAYHAPWHPDKHLDKGVIFCCCSAHMLQRGLSQCSFVRRSDVAKLHKWNNDPGATLCTTLCTCQINPVSLLDCLGCQWTNTICWMSGFTCKIVMHVVKFCQMNAYNISRVLCLQCLINHMSNKTYSMRYTYAKECREASATPPSTIISQYVRE